MTIASITVKVSQENIDRAVGPDLAYQILKLALDEAGYPNAELGVTTIWLNGINGCFYATMPPVVMRFKNALARGFAPEPFFFDLDVKQIEGLRP